MANKPTEVDFQLAARMSAIEVIVEIFCANQLQQYNNPEELLKGLRDTFQKPPSKLVGAEQHNPKQMEAFQKDMQIFGTYLIDRIARRYAEIRKA